MLNQNPTEEPHHSAPNSPSNSFNAEKMENSGPKSMSLTSSNLIQGDTHKLLNMGSNGQPANSNIAQPPDVAEVLQKQENDQENLEKPAEIIPEPEQKLENLCEKDGKNSETQKLENIIVQETKENLNTLSVIAQPSQVKPEDLPVQTEQLKNSEDDKNCAESLPTLPNLPEALQTTEVVENKQEDQLEPEERAPSVPSSPRKNDNIEGDNRSPGGNQGNSPTKLNAQKRVLRERKTRTMVNNDPVSKCHV